MSWIGIHTTHSYTTHTYTHTHTHTHHTHCTEVDITLQPSEPVVVTEGASFLTYTLNKTGEAVRNVKVDIDLSGQL